MKINSLNLNSLYNTARTAPKNVQRAQQTEKTAAAQKTAGKDRVELTQRQKDVQEFRQLLSTDERKMFDLLFPADKQTGNVKTGPTAPERTSNAVGNRYKTIERPVRQKTVGSRFDIRG